MGRNNSKRRYNYLNNIKEEPIEEIVAEPKAEEIIIEQEVELEEKE